MLSDEKWKQDSDDVTGVISWMVSSLSSLNTHPLGLSHLHAKWSMRHGDAQALPASTLHCELEY